MRQRLSDPMQDFFELRDRLYRLLDESFQPQQTEEAPSFSPPVDILATDDEVVILVEVPGMSRDDVTVEVEEDVVTIRGERAAEDDGQYYVRERPVGRFRRSFSLAYHLDPESVTARLEDGLLEVTVKRRQPARQISVTGDED